ncbi:hypothetical protein F4802DRAFT_584120 [Xylaria palmicola]|nr:hypothetical protein F4802DRAFT_584120 [Xylaria palmicola]
MTNKIHYEIPLFDVGVDGAGFRVENDGDELQRSTIDQYKDSDIKYVADLVAVVHGTMTPRPVQPNRDTATTSGEQIEHNRGPIDKNSAISGGRSGVLLVIDFQFLSVPEKHRFKRVQLTVAFALQDDPIGSANEPIVRQLAPAGTFGLDEAMQMRETKFEAHASLECGWNPAMLGIGSSLERTTTTNTKSHAIINGMSWIEGRNKGPKNAAVWDLRENSTLKSGVPAYLRAAILLELPEVARFRAEVAMIADIGTFRKKVKRKVGAKTGLQPVYFDPSEAERKDLGPHPEAGVEANLGGCNLGSIGYAQVSRLPGAMQQTEL